jgi:hypothetical protein
LHFLLSGCNGYTAIYPIPELRRHELDV